MCSALADTLLIEACLCQEAVFGARGSSAGRRGVAWLVGPGVASPKNRPRGVEPVTRFRVVPSALPGPLASGACRRRVGGRRRC